MKKLIITNCILAIAVIFSFCAKPNLQEDLSQVNITDITSSRSFCTLINNTVPVNAATITLCGTNTNELTCSNCIPPNKEVTGVVQSQGGQLSLELEGPICFQVTSDLPTWVNFSTLGGNALPPVFIAAGACELFCIDEKCVIMHI